MDTTLLSAVHPLDNPDYHTGRAAAYARIRGMIERGSSLQELFDESYAGQLDAEAAADRADGR